MLLLDAVKPTERTDILNSMLFYNKLSRVAIPFYHQTDQNLLPLNQ
jgi:hypothetical protein